MICIDPEYPFNNVMAPFDLANSPSGLPEHMTVLHCPVDFRLKRAEIHHLIKTIEPENVLLPIHVARHLDIKSIQANITGKLYMVEPMGNISIRNLKRKFEQAKISDELAMEIFPKQMKGMNVSRIAARLHAKDGSYTLLPATQDLAQISSEKQAQKMLFGDVNVERIVHSLQSEGLDVNVAMQYYGMYNITVPSISANISFCTEETEINAPTKHIRDF